MAEAIVSVVLDQLASIILEEIEQEVRLVVGARKEVENLTTTFKFIKALLEDAEKKQVMSETVKFWLQELKNIAYDADDVLDEWYTRIFISQRSQTKKVAAKRSGIAKKVVSYLSSPCYCFHPVIVRHEIAHKIKELRERLDAVARDRDGLNLTENHTHEVRPRQITSSVVDVAEIRGRDLDIKVIVNRLLGDSSQSGTQVPVPIISIVGTAGFGKTTLAQLVFQEETVMTMFELKIWVCVSEPFDLERITREIIGQTKSTEENVQTVVGWEALHQQLCESVKGKRFLLVLDDVWSEDRKDWTPLKLSLDGGERGSRIIITTRNERVAKMMGSTYMHRLGHLSDEDCWLLFKQIAFWGRSQEELERLQEIGIEIAKRCKGVPLAAKALASLMRFKQAKHDWRNVLESDIWDVQQVEEGFLPALLLSYQALPSYLKQCFMYCAIFPKDKKIDKDLLVKLWMAQGYLGSDGGKELEMIGAEYFDDLAMRSFFQEFEKDDEGNIVSCKMHDLVHDFAYFLTRTECLIIQTEGLDINASKVRHLTALNEDNPSIYKARNLRTLISTRSWKPVPLELFHQTCFRALDLSGYYSELPSEVGRLLHLRYLDLSQTKLSKLFETVCELYNLQTLKLNSCRSLCELPEGIGGLLNLRHVEVDETPILEYFPSGIGRLNRLRTLSKFIVSGASGGCTIEELRDLNFLRGNLEIIGLRQVKTFDEAKLAELEKKKNLCSLELDFGYFQDDYGYIREDDSTSMEAVAEGLQPHNNLDGLGIYGYPGMMFPSWMQSESLLSNVVRLKLYGCELCTGLPALGKLRSLEVLHIINLNSVKHIGLEFYGVGVGTSVAISFPKLKVLLFDGMKELGHWDLPYSKFKKIMPYLENLDLLDCPKLMGLPALGKLESLKSIDMRGLFSVNSVGFQFLGLSDDSGDCKSMPDGSQKLVEQPKKVIFPKLRKLSFDKMRDWELWDLPLFHQNYQVDIMPSLIELKIHGCPKLKVLPALGRLQSLEYLGLWDLPTVKHVSAEVLGLSSDSGNGDSASASTLVLFPKLTNLKLEYVRGWEERDDESLEISTTTSIMPCLYNLVISGCEKLKVVPHYMFPQSLRKLLILNCPKLTGTQPCLPPLLEELRLVGLLGVVSSSLIPITHNNCYPNLKIVAIGCSLHSSLPEGLKQLTSLKYLYITNCEFLDLNPDEFKNMPMLQHLMINSCPILEERMERGLNLFKGIAFVKLNSTLQGYKLQESVMLQ